MGLTGIHLQTACRVAHQVAQGDRVRVGGRDLEVEVGVDVGVELIPAGNCVGVLFNLSGR
jgi:hypothetical protein